MDPDRQLFARGNLTRSLHEGLQPSPEIRGVSNLQWDHIIHEEVGLTAQRLLGLQLSEGVVFADVLLLHPFDGMVLSRLHHGEHALMGEDSGRGEEEAEVGMKEEGE